MSVEASQAKKDLRSARKESHCPGVSSSGGVIMLNHCGRNSKVSTALSSEVPSAARWGQRAAQTSWRFCLVTLIGSTSISCNLATESASQPPVHIGSIEWLPNPSMVTGGMLHVQCTGATALQISYVASGLDSASTPRVPVSNCPARAALLGLLPSTTYRTRVTAWGQAGDSSIAPGPVVSTGELPNTLPMVNAVSLAGISSGLTVFTVLNPVLSASEGTALIVDSIGRIRWYLQLNQRIQDLEPEADGRLFLSLMNSDPFVSGQLDYITGQYHAIDMAGNYLGKWTITGPYFTDAHEIRMTSRGTALLLGFDIRQMDLSSFGGQTNAQVVGNLLQEVDSVGRIFFLWNAFDHFGITDIDPSVPLTGARIDWNHGNAVEIDADGNYLISFRNLSEVSKISSQNGTVLWRLGGARNEFQFGGDTSKFSFQHGVRRLANGNLILFDNGNTHSPPFSRAVEYRVDETARTATLVWQYRPDPDLYSFALGFAQRLSSGNTLVTFGPRSTVHEVSPSSRLLWSLTLPGGGWIYRAYRIRSLYDSRLDIPGN